VQARPATMAWDLVGGVHVRCTGRDQGDMVSGRPGVEDRRAAVVAMPWSVPTQVHGAKVLTVTRPGGGAGEQADALVTTTAGVAVAVLSADCAPVALASAEGVLGVAHAGWRGLRDGVIEATVGAMRSLGATEVDAVLGPCIRAECYHFGSDDLDVMVERLGPSVRSEDRDGGPSLDIPAAVGAALAACGARLAVDAGVCTGCGDGYWSWRARADTDRQATVAWRG
jgi:YfiH family protein